MKKVETILGIAIIAASIISFSAGNIYGMYQEANNLDHRQKTVILDQEFTVNLSQNFENDKITILGTVPKSNYYVSGLIYQGEAENTRLIYAFKILSDEDGLYKIVVDTNDSNWSYEKFTLSVKHDGESKQVIFER